jgi:uncharacterized membrane protein YfbV (UPF0208 family)
MRPRVIENRVIKIGSDHNKFCPSFNPIFTSVPKIANSQQTYAEVRVVQTAFAYSSVSLQTIFVKEPRATAEVTDLLTYLLTYLLTPWSRVPLEKLIGLQLVKKFPAFYRTRRFLTALTDRKRVA